MASRRVRIKGIANIPQRRKPTKTSEEVPENQEEYDGDKSKEIEDNVSLNVTADADDNLTDVTDQTNKDILTNINSEDQVSQVSNKITAAIDNNRSVSAEINGSSSVQHILPTNEIKCTKKEVEECCASSDNEINTKEISEESKKQPEKQPITRRKFLKPSICVNALNRNVRGRTEETKINNENLQENGDVNLNEIEISTNNTHTGLIIQKNEPPSGGSSASDFGKLASKDSGKSGSDTEYHQPPASPTKILNRRIKAIPKLHQRRTSFSIGSASESEDDTRRSGNRIRNDSVCSANSGANESHFTSEARSPTRKEYTVVQRKSRRNEQTRKLAEARREFNMKFNNGKPDKQKLTMIDLIFYNPATSPMSHNKRKRTSTCSSNASDPTPRTEEEKADDPQPVSDSDNELPAPQIKVGPNGEIVVDEKSLIIENAETKKGREALQQSEIVNGDDDTSYGVYKRVKRTKEWSKDETLRFYKALNTIGTDFTLMCELFPNRTRRELKMKFKKEERLNHALINKAVMQPSEFDMTELRKDLEVETRRIEESKKRAEETKIIKDATGEYRKKVKKGMKVKGIAGDFIEPPPTTETAKPAPVKKRKKTRYDVIKGGISSILSESDEEDDSLESTTTTNKENESNDEEDEENVSNILKPTRYGRVPRARAPDSLDAHAKQVVKKKRVEEEEGSDKNEEDLEPGSIVVVKTKTTTDDLVYKVYFVTDNQTKQQIDLSPKVLKDLTGLSGDKVRSEGSGIQTHNILTISTQKFSDDTQLNVKETGSNNTAEEQLKCNQSSNLDIKELALPDSALNSGNIEIVGDRIILPYDESLTQTVGNQNITVSHEDNKMIVVTEN